MPNISIVTGGTGGMGITIAQHLAKNTKVIVTGRSQSGYDRVKDAFSDFDVEFMLADCTKKEDMERVAKDASEKGFIKNIIHTAGISEFTNGKRNTPEAIAKTNIPAIINVIESFLPYLGEGTSIVSIASMTSYVDLEYKHYGDAFPSALEGNYEKVLEYGAGSSSTTYAVTKTFMRWYCTSNVERITALGATINTISPGIIETPMTASIENDSPGSISGMKYIIPCKRLGNTEDIAKAVDFLVSSPYVCAADILVDGGYTNSSKLDQII